MSRIARRVGPSRRHIWFNRSVDNARLCFAREGRPSKRLHEPADQTVARPHLTAALRYYADFMMDVLVYMVVLNLFVEFVDSIVIDSFLVSLLTAVVMKVMIDLINSLVAAMMAALRLGTAIFVRLGGPGAESLEPVAASGGA
jgi:hypothetical protein